MLCASLHTLHLGVKCLAQAVSQQVEAEHQQAHDHDGWDDLKEFVLASRTLGAGSFFIIFKEVLPNIIGPIITQVMFSMSISRLMTTMGGMI